MSTTFDDAASAVAPLPARPAWAPLAPAAATAAEAPLDPATRRRAALLGTVLGLAAIAVAAVIGLFHTSLGAIA